MALIKNTTAVMNYPIIGDLEPKIFSSVSFFLFFRINLFASICDPDICDELARC